MPPRRKGTFLKCAHCGKKVKSTSMARHVAQCRKHPEREDTAEEWKLSTTANLFQTDAEMFVEEDMLSIDSREYQDNDPRSPGGSAGSDDHGVIAEGRAAEKSIPQAVRYDASEFRMEWLTFQGLESEDDVDEEQERQERAEAEAVEIIDDASGDWDHVGVSDGTVAAVAGAPGDCTSAIQLELEYRNVSSRGRYAEKKEWSWYPPADIGGKLKESLATEDGRTLGLCFEVAEDNRIPLQLESSEVTMLRLMDYCDMNPHHSRKFLDGLLDILQDEISVRKFQLHERPRRDTVASRVVGMYGAGCVPEVAPLKVFTEEGNVVLTEEEAGDNTAEEERAIEVPMDQLHQSSQYRSEPLYLVSPERYTVDVIRFNMTGMILDLLDDETVFGSLDNLVVNDGSTRSPFEPYQNVSGFSEEILDGTWYSETIERLRRFEEDKFVDGADFLFPVIMYVDKTGTSMNQRYPLEPFLFTTAIIKRKLRNLPKCWRPLGFIPDLETKSSAESRYTNDRNRGATAKSYHRALEYLLEDFQRIQNEGILTWLQLGKYRKKVRLRPELAFIIQDGKSADMITLRIPSTHAMRRISRSCETLQKDCVNLQDNCTYLELTPELRKHLNTVGMSPKEIQESPLFLEGTEKPTYQEAKSVLKNAENKLEALSFHPARNAFVARDIRCGLDPRHIWGATPVDLMHAFQSGILMYVVRMVLDNLATRSQVLLDRLVHKLFHDLRCGEKQDYPRMNFSKGFTKLTMLTSDEWPGKLFVLVLALSTEDGQAIFREAQVFDDEGITLPESYDDKNVPSATQAADLDKKYREDFKEEFQEDDIPASANEEGSKETAKGKGRTYEEDPEEMTRKCSIHDFLELAEALLCFHAWYKLAMPKIMADGRIDHDSISGSIKKLLAMVRFFTPRKKGNGWNLQKFHDLLHIATDMLRFGPPGNYDAGPHESGLRYWAKLPAVTSQMRGYNTFAKQVGGRTFEFQSMATAMRKHGLIGVRDRARVRDSGEGILDEEPRLQGTRYRVYFSRKSGGMGTDKRRGKDNRKDDTGVQAFQPTKVFQKKNAKTTFSVSPVIENFLRAFQTGPGMLGPKEDSSGGKKEIYWELVTEVSAVLPDEDKRVTIRCHPNYKNDGPWFDWVMVRFSTTDVDFWHKGDENKFVAAGNNINDFSAIREPTQFEDDCVPCKVLAAMEDEEGDVKLLVHGCLFRTSGVETANDSVLLEFWNLSYSQRYDSLPREGNVAIPKKAPTQSMAEFREAREAIRTQFPTRERAYDGSTLPRDTRTYETPDLYWVELSNIVCRCLVVEETPGIFETVPIANGKKLTRVALVRRRSLWPEEFT